MEDSHSVEDGALISAPSVRGSYWPFAFWAGVAGIVAFWISWVLGGLSKVDEPGLQLAAYVTCILTLIGLVSYRLTILRNAFLVVVAAVTFWPLSLIGAVVGGFFAGGWGALTGVLIVGAIGSFAIRDA